MLMKEYVDIIEKFYSSFANGDSGGMKPCYHEELEFENPAFGVLNYDELVPVGNVSQTHQWS